jgi:hypothetical protein
MTAMQRPERPAGAAAAAAATAVLFSLLAVRPAAGGDPALDELAAEVKRMYSAPHSIARERFLLPEQLKASWDHAAQTVAATASRLGAGDEAVGAAVSGLAAKTESADAYLAVVEAVVRRAGVAGARELTAMIPELFQYDAAANGALARGLAQQAEAGGTGAGASADVRRTLLGGAVDAASRALSGSGDDAEVRRALVDAIEKRGVPETDARVYVELVKVHPKDAEFNYRAGCHLAGLWTGARPADRLPVIYPESTRRNWHQALDHFKVARKTLVTDRLFRTVDELLISRLILDAIERRTMTWAQKDQALAPVSRRLEKLLAPGPIPLAHLVRALNARAASDARSAVAELNRIPGDQRPSHIKKLLADLEKAAARQSVEGAPQAIYRVGAGSSAGTRIVRVGLEPGTLRVWYRTGSPAVRTVTLGGSVCSRAFEVMATVLPTDVERRSAGDAAAAAPTDPAGTDRAELFLDRNVDPARVGSVEVTVLGEAGGTDGN